MNARQPKPQPENENDQTATTQPRYCGIVMPISPMLPEYDAAHWERVKEVLELAIEDAGLTPRLVSETEAINIIQKEIVQNLYNDEIVVVDVSGKNANVMFELGLRLAFDKPTVIVQDDSNKFEFDIGSIKHILYRKDQRYDDVSKFKSNVTNAIKATLKAKQDDATYSPFLAHYGKFTPKIVEGHEIPQADYIVGKLASLEKLMSRNLVGTMQLVEQDSVLSGGISAADIAAYSYTDEELDWINRTRFKIREVAKDGSIATRDPAKLKITMKKFVADSLVENGLPLSKYDRLFDIAWNMERNGHSFPSRKI